MVNAIDIPFDIDQPVIFSRYTYSHKQKNDDLKGGFARIHAVLIIKNDAGVFDFRYKLRFYCSDTSIEAQNFHGLAIEKAANRYGKAVMTKDFMLQKHIRATL